MAKSLQIQTNFTGGEISPRLWGHVDFSRYKNSLKNIMNAVILPHGPVKRRNGSKFIDSAKSASTKCRLIPFQFDQTDAYVLEFSNNAIRFYKNGALLLDGGSPYEVVTTYTTAELFSLVYVQYGRQLYISHSAHPLAILEWTSDTSWALTNARLSPPPTQEDGWEPSTSLILAATTGSGINASTTSSSIFTASDAGRQIISLIGPGRATITAVGASNSATVTILENFTTTAYGAGDWKIDLSPIVSVTPSGPRRGALISLTASQDAWTGFEPNYPMYAILNNGVLKFRSVTSVTVANMEVQKSLDAVTASTNWSLETEVWNSTLGYPGVVALHQQRLFAASNVKYPQNIWASEVGIFDSFGVGSRDADALDFEISGKQVNNISWMATLRSQLIVGTPSSEITIESSGQALTPSSLSQEVRSYHGSLRQQPIGLDDQIIYVQKSGQKINALRYDFQVDGYVSDDLLFFAQHMCGDAKIVDLAYASDPDRALYAVLDDGDLLVCTYMREQQVVAWARFTTLGQYESVAVISTGVRDEIYLAVKRTISGSATRYIERLDWSDGTGYVDGFSDSYLTYYNPLTITGFNKSTGVMTINSHGLNNGDYFKAFEVEGVLDSDEKSAINGKTFIVGSVTTHTFQLLDTGSQSIDFSGYTSYISGGTGHKLVTVISGLSHLEGKTVQVKADGATSPDQVVSSGSITLPKRSFAVTVGLQYRTLINTLPQEYNLGEGSQQGQQHRFIRPILRFYQSCIPTLNGAFLPARKTTDLMDSRLPLVTGDLFYGDITWEEGFASILEIETSLPYPCMLLGIYGSQDGGSQ